MRRDDDIIWHDVENGGYEADLETWRRLAAAEAGPILDLGCGTGRVALHLARRGHRVLGVDVHARLLATLRRRAAESGLAVEVVEADIRELPLGGRRFGLAVAPMQVLQLLSGGPERIEAMRSARAALKPGGLLATAIVTDAPEETWMRGDHPPLPDVREDEEWIYSSLPLAVGNRDGRIVIERLRQIVGPEGELSEEPNRVELAMVDAAGLEAEGREAGFESAGRVEIGGDPNYADSVIVLLRAGEPE